MQPGVQLFVLRYGVGHDQRGLGAAQRVLGTHHLGDLPGRGHRPVDRLARTAQVEPGERVRAVAEHPDAQRLQPLQRGRDVQDRLHTRAHHGDPRTRQQPQVRRLVLRLGPAPVHPAEPAGREDPQPGPGRQVGGRGHGRRPARPGRQRRGEVAVPQLAHPRVLGHPFQLGLVQPDPGPPVQHRHGRGHGPGGPHEPLQLPGDPQIAGAGQTVGDDRRLQGDDRPVRGEGGPHLGGEDRRVGGGVEGRVE